MPNLPTPLTSLTDQLTIVGAGTMAQAMVRRWIDCGFDPARVTAVRPSGAPVADDVLVVQSIDDLGSGALTGVVLLAVKPQLLDSVTDALASRLGPDVVLVSILAGTPLDMLRDRFGTTRHIVRAMPNMQVAHGMGVVALWGGAGIDPVTHQRVTALMQPLGDVLWPSDEGDFEAITALSGCGPAFTYRFIAALVGAGMRLGLDADTADRLARTTVMGAATDAARSADSLMDMAGAVASKGGVTQAGLDVLDADGRLAALMTDTLRAARDRGREMAVQLRGDAD